MADPKKVSPDAALQVAFELLLLRDEHNADPRLRAMAENYIADALNGKPLNIIKIDE
jgi:hypothetical protein